MYIQVLHMLNYLFISILFFTNLFSSDENRKHSVILFYINDQVESVNIINEVSRLVDYEPLNKFLIDNHAFKLERWSKFASSDDVYNGLRFSRIYTAYFSDDVKISNIKNELEKLNFIDRVEYDSSVAPSLTNI